MRKPKHKPKHKDYNKLLKDISDLITKKNNITFADMDKDKRQIGKKGREQKLED